ncbi:hypothetical protein AQJ27_46475 [Streptomyces olivochromogenes]|nr:hypothetical protein AQJ27_46475 [Streptomyces olivochromogenes]
MTMLAITPGLLVIFMVSGAVFVAVYLHTKRRSTEVPAAGDLGTAGSTESLARPASSSGPTLTTELEPRGPCRCG